jgi:KDO2-lipid IV(A) lauroyltransferase
MVLYLLYRIGQFISTALPLKICYWIAENISDIKFYFSPKSRSIVFSNMKNVTGKSDKECLILTRKVYRNFGKYLVDFFRIAKLSKATLKQTAFIENPNFIEQMFKEHKSLIGVTAHIGNWELLGIAVSILGFPVEAVALAHKERRINDFFIKQRQRQNLSVIPVSNAAKMCIQSLKKRTMVALLGDRDFSGTYIKVIFFKKLALFPRGPAVLYLKTRSPIIFGFAIRQKDDRYKLIFEKMEDFAPSGNTKEDIKNVTQRIASVIERYVSMDPSQWLIFSSPWEGA